MTDKKDSARGGGLRHLRQLADEADLTVDEARQELERDGVDINAAVGQALAYVAAKKREARVAAWQPAAQAKARAFHARQPRRDYSGLSHSQLIDCLKSRPVARVGHHKFEELTEEALRTLLEDADDLETDDGQDGSS
jgi:hypothetical protein